MTLRRYHRSCSWLTALALSSGALQVCFVSVGHAEEDSATETAAARSLAVDGLKLAQAGRCEEAIPKLDRAERLHHSAIVLSRLGECQVSEGKLVEGTEMLRKVLREPLPANPTAALSKAYERAQIVLDGARPKIGALTISLSTVPPSLRLVVDGTVVPNSLVDSELPADPGDHLIEASAPGFLKASAHVNLSSAERRTISLKLDADPNAPAPTPATTSPATEDAAAAPRPATAVSAPALTSAPPPAPPAEAPSRATAYVSWGVGVVGIGVGTAFGLMAMKDKHTLDGQCQANKCPAERSDAVDAAKRNGNVSTIAFGVGGAGLLLGTVLYFSLSGSSAQSRVATPPRTFAGLQNGRALLGPGSVQLAADF